MQKALYDLWFTYYNSETTGEQRSELAAKFIEEYNITTQKARHPAHYRRESLRSKLYEVTEILADFIIRAEDDESGLTASRQTIANRKYRKKEQEMNVDFSDLYDDEEGGVNILTEFDVYSQAVDLYAEFTEEVESELTVNEFKAMIESVKKNAEEYAAKYSRKYGKDYKDTLQRIKRLDVDRVAICEECGEVFYKHDMRRKYCDLRPSCEVNAKRRRESERYFKNKSKKVKVRAETLHNLVESPKNEPVFMAR